MQTAKRASENLKSQQMGLLIFLGPGRKQNVLLSCRERKAFVSFWKFISKKYKRYTAPVRRDHPTPGANNPSKVTNHLMNLEGCPSLTSRT